MLEAGEGLRDFCQSRLATMLLRCLGSTFTPIRRDSMCASRIDPTLPATPSLRPVAVDHLKDRLTFLANGHHRVHHLMALTRDLLRSGWDEFTFENLDELDGWLAGRMQAGRAETRIRWTIIRDVFVSVRVLARG
jgi:hypothetical protein